MGDEVNVTLPYDWYGTTVDYVGGATSAPDAPIVSYSNHGGHLTWDDVDNEDAYVIERSENDGAFIPVARVPRDTSDVGNEITWYDAWARPVVASSSPTYTYRVRAYNIAGAGTSNEVGGTTINRSAFGVDQAEYRDSSDPVSWNPFWGPAVQVTAWNTLRFDNVYFDGVVPDQILVKLRGGGATNSTVDFYLDGTDPGDIFASITTSDGAGYVYSGNVDLGAINSSAHTIYIKSSFDAGPLDWWQFKTLAAPASPTDLAAERLSDESLKLTWKDRSHDNSGFKIYRTVTHPDGSFDSTSFTITDADASNWTDPTNVPATTDGVVRYWLAATNSFGESEPVWPIETPARPSVTVTTDNQTRLAVQWTRSMGEYGDILKLEHREVGTTTWLTGGGEWGEDGVATHIPGFAYMNNVLTPGRHYEVRVRFVRNGVPSAWSTPDDAITQPLAPTTSIAALAPDLVDIGWTVDEDQLTDGYSFWWGDPTGSQTGYPTYPSLLPAETSNIAFTHFGTTPIASLNHDLFFDMVAALYGSSPTYSYWGGSRVTLDLDDRPTDFAVDPVTSFNVSANGSLSWELSEAPDAEYAIYRGTSMNGPFTRISSFVVGDELVDGASLAPGNYIYMIRVAVPHEGEDYYDLSMPVYGVRAIGTSGADTFSAKLNTSTNKVDFYNGAPTGTPALSIDRSKLSAIAFAGANGDDAMIIDLPATEDEDDGLALDYDGGSGTNSASIIGTSGDDYTQFDTLVAFADSAMSFANVATWAVDGNGEMDTVFVYGMNIRFTNDLGAESAREMVATAEAVVEYDTTQHFSSLTLDEDALVRLNTNGSRALIVGQIPILNGQIDLRDNDMILTGGFETLGTLSGSTYDGVTGYIQSGRNGGGWTGDGIVTSMTQATTTYRTTLGVADAATLLGISGSQTAMWNGYTVDASAILVKYTYGGDVDLSGTIDGTDFDIFDDASVASPWPGGYTNADVNYDGVFDADDQFIVDSNYGYAFSHGPL